MTDPGSFELHPVLARDTLAVASLALCELRLMNDARYAWAILVPRIAGITHLHEVPAPRRADLLDEIEAVSRCVLAIEGVTRVNVAALGNVVQQLHVHVVGRHPGDATWPGPVWGQGSAVAYAPAAAARRIRELAVSSSAR